MSMEVWSVRVAVLGVTDRPTDEQLDAMHEIVNGVSSHDKHIGQFRLLYQTRYDRAAEADDIITFTGRLTRTALRRIGQRLPNITEFETVLVSKESE